MGHVLAHRLLLASWMLMLGLSGCGDEPVVDQASVDTRASYPSGPYGTVEGSNMEDLTFLSSDGTPVSLSDVRLDGGNRLILIATAAGWCTACIEEQAWLQALHERHVDDGLFVLVAIFEDANFDPATPQLAAEWKARNQLDVAVVADPGFVLEPYFRPELIPMVTIVDADTMEIVRMTSGWEQSDIEALLESRLQ